MDQALKLLVMKDPGSKSPSDSGSRLGCVLRRSSTAHTRNVHTRSLISLGPAAQPVSGAKLARRPARGSSVLSS